MRARDRSRCSSRLFPKGCRSLQQSREVPPDGAVKQHRSIARQLDVLRRRAIHDVLYAEFRCEIIRSAQFFLILIFGRVFGGSFGIDGAGGNAAGEGCCCGSSSQRKKKGGFILHDGRV